MVFFRALGLAIGFLAAWLLLVTFAHAAPPPGADPSSAVARWVHSLRNTSRMDQSYWMGCCDFSDCRPTAVRMTDDGRVEVWIGRDEFGASAPDAWLEADEHAQRAISDGPPPDGRSWVCYFGGKVQCWAPGTGG